MINLRHYQSGFTLFELLIVVAIIAILATIVIVALDPLKQLREGRNSARYSHVNSLSTALYRFVIDKSAYPEGLDGTLRQLGTASSGCNLACANAAPGCLDLSTSIADYMPMIPLDPKIGTNEKTGYAVVKNPDNNIITVRACGAEGDKIIFLMR